MSVLFIVGLLLSSILHGAASSSSSAGISSVSSVISDELQKDSITFSATVKGPHDRFPDEIDYTLDLNRQDSCAGKSYRELYQDAKNRNIPWIIGVFSSWNMLQLVQPNAQPKIRCYDICTIFERLKGEYDSIHFSNHQLASRALQNDFQKKMGLVRAGYLSVHMLDRNGNKRECGGKFLGDDDSIFSALLRFVMYNDVPALKKIADGYNRVLQNKKKGAVKQLFDDTIFWSERYVQEVPSDAHMLHRIGRLQQTVGNIPAAYRSFAKAAKLGHAKANEHLCSLVAMHPELEDEIGLDQEASNPT